MRYNILWLIRKNIIYDKYDSTPKNSNSKNTKKMNLNYPQLLLNKMIIL